ncbi:MAG TPA: hypothetical protein H9871_05680 [Candidatus Nesterenkonia stercoripullorum]|uniref:Uncharacterized protein n=1 Tax=Candidatus Nesterenkonia stercoripullorum TaxID=2838701 RepID=A0A9D1S2J7_9MICC|nr:hypothetical protein [Candidatus Nesterenkonia stercoripullorum]
MASGVPGTEEEPIEIESYDDGRRSARRESSVRWGASALVFLVGLALMIIIMFPDPWSVLAGLVVGGAGGASTYGVLLGRTQARDRAAATDRSRKSLGSTLDDVETTIQRRSGQLPPSTRGQLRMIVVGLREIVDRWEFLDKAPEQQHAVQRLTAEYVPKTLELFLALPDEDKPRYAPEFKEQVNMLAEGVAKTRDTVVTQNIQELRNHGWLLSESLEDPDERLFRDHGL